MLDNYLEVDGKKLEVLFLFNYKERDFVVYECPDGEISASIINNKGALTLEKITSDEDWDYVDKKLEEYLHSDDENWIKI